MPGVAAAPTSTSCCSAPPQGRPCASLSRPRRHMVVSKNRAPVFGRVGPPSLWGTHITAVSAENKGIRFFNYAKAAKPLNCLFFWFLLWCSWDGTDATASTFRSQSPNPRPKGQKQRCFNSEMPETSSSDLCYCQHFPGKEHNDDSSSRKQVRVQRTKGIQNPKSQA